MKITTTRVATLILSPLVAAMTKELDEVDANLATQLITLSKADRKSTPRTRLGFRNAARTFANVMITRPEICAVTGFDAEEVIEDLDNVELIAPLIPRVRKLLRCLEDTHLKWLAEAQEPVLATYAVAKVRSERDGTLEELIAPMQKVLANGPAKLGEATETADGEADSEESAPKDADKE